jgi:protein involved in polysaccharide export with SLBB domain
MASVVSAETTAPTTPADTNVAPVVSSETIAPTALSDTNAVPVVAADADDVAPHQSFLQRLRTRMRERSERRAAAAAEEARMAAELPLSTDTNAPGSLTGADADAAGRGPSNATDHVALVALPAGTVKPVGDAASPALLPVHGSGSTVGSAATVTPAPQPDSQAGALPAAATDSSDVHLRPGLTIQLQALVRGQKESEEKDRRSSDGGALGLPLIGVGHRDGRTLQGLRDELGLRYSEFFLHPQIVIDYVVGAGEEAISPWGYVTVLGKVKHPGRVNIPPTRDLTVAAAIQRAGGLDSSAKESSIRVTRPTGDTDGKPDVVEVDLRALGKSGAKKNDLILKPGDVVFVPEMIF